MPNDVGTAHGVDGELICPIAWSSDVLLKNAVRILAVR